MIDSAKPSLTLQPTQIINSFYQKEAILTIKYDPSDFLLPSNGTISIGWLLYSRMPSLGQICPTLKPDPAFITCGSHEYYPSFFDKLKNSFPSEFLLLIPKELVIGRKNVFIGITMSHLHFEGEERLYTSPVICLEVISSTPTED
jgi:hypothetical protein